MPYPGSKSRHAGWITEYFPDHDCYVEPFAGVAGVLLNKDRSHIEIVNDKNGDLVNLLTVLRDHRDGLAEWVEHSPYSRELHAEYREAIYGDGKKPDDPVEWAGMVYYLQYSSFGGKIDDAFMVPNYNDNDGNWRRRSKPYVDHTTDIPALSARLQGVVIEQLDYSDVFDRYDSPSTLFYCDPPYVEKGGYYPHGVDHAEFAELLKGTVGDWVVSYDTVPDELSEYLEASKDSVHSIDGASQSRTAENLLMNFDPN